MARRIAAAILLTVWAILVAGGFATYWVSRSVLVGDLDSTLTHRALVVAEAQARGDNPDRAVADMAAAEDRYVISNGLKQNLGRAPGAGDARSVPPRQKGWFSRLGDGRLMRTVSVQVPAPGAPGGAISVTYSGRADQVGRVLERLAVTLRSPPRPARRPARDGTAFRGSVAASQTQVNSAGSTRDPSAGSLRPSRPGW